jgi:hypothetical protein
MPKYIKDCKTEEEREQIRKNIKLSKEHGERMGFIKAEANLLGRKRKLSYEEQIQQDELGFVPSGLSANNEVPCAFF